MPPMVIKSVLQAVPQIARLPVALEACIPAPEGRAERLHPTKGSSSMRKWQRRPRLGSLIDRLGAST